jgi:hypothetical protein
MKTPLTRGVPPRSCGWPSTTLWMSRTRSGVPVGFTVAGCFHDYERALEGTGGMTIRLDRWQEAGARGMIDSRSWPQRLDVG